LRENKDVTVDDDLFGVAHRCFLQATASILTEFRPIVTSRV